MSLSDATSRPPVSLVVPFGGEADEVRPMLTGLAELELRDDDELIVVDNTVAGAVRPGPDSPAVRVIAAIAERSAYFARNAGAERAANPWILFMDADCRPAPTLLDDYFAAPLGERCAVVAGAVVPASGQRSLIARYAQSREHISERYHMTTGPYPAGITANLLVRRSAWESLGGFHEGIRSGGDVEFCWRAQELGWTLAHRPEASVEHIHVERLGAMVRKTRRHAAGRLWVNRRYPGTCPRPRVLRPLARCAAAAIVWTLTARLQRALFKLIDAVWVCADVYGYVLGDNRARREQARLPKNGAPRLVVVTDAFPARSETFIYNEIRALCDAGWSVRVESSARPARPERAVSREVPITYLEDDPPTDKLRDLAWLGCRHPIRFLRDRARRRAWGREAVWPLAGLAPAARRLARGAEPHMHVHFAALAALHALRIGRLVGVPYSLAAHAHDIFQSPRNLEEKLIRARFVAAPCEYTAAHLRGLVAPKHRARIHVVVMGIDGERFRRRRPYSGGRKVVAVGRLVEKKGFAYLIEAAALLRSRAALEQVTIAGDGELRGELEQLIAQHELTTMVEIVDAWGGDAIRELLEGADLLAMPAVVASDGDRDAMPVVVKEALAMEIPVVATDEVGLPEVVHSEWGRLVPPRDATALADAIAELLALPPQRRSAMGAAGREFVLESCEVGRETEKLARLIAGAGGLASRRRYSIGLR